ncbi:hypothetical protein [Microcella sp.]|uniref:hypothetical protein n=1 Tax=Microcella sp. TaxID=1913979 RepID=UPI0025608D29|nr:hypothetical protein [Microcella sp.]MBX9472745.1 hypothetical protein [Microcella sp.]
MSSLQRVVTALPTVALVVLALAACAPEPEPEAQPTQTIAPTPTETIAAPSAPGSRVPMTCEQLFAGVDGFTGGPAVDVALDSLLLKATVDQAGFEYCTISGAIGATPVEIRTVVGVEIDEAVIQRSIEFAEEYGLGTNVGGELSYSECIPVDTYSYCVTEIFAGGYVLQFSTSPDGPVAADFEQSFRSFAADLGDRALAWPAPAPAWAAPEGALTWAHTCETEVAASDAAIRAAMPFEVMPPTIIGSGDGFSMFYEAERRQQATSCSWYGSGEQYGSVSVEIAPGAAWIVEQGTPLPGTAIDYPGALAASVVDWPSEAEPTQAWLWVAIDGSIVVVEVSTGGVSFDRQAAIEASTRVVDAVVAEFGTP